jgi:hypothetical protein
MDPVSAGPQLELAAVQGICPQSVGYEGSLYIDAGKPVMAQQYNRFDGPLEGRQPSVKHPQFRV